MGDAIEDEYVSGDTRGASLKLAQRHHRIVAGQFRGRRTLEPELAHPGVVGKLALCFTPSAALPKESRLTCVLPHHGWGIPSDKANGINAVLMLPQGLPVSSLQTTYATATRTLEFTLLSEEIPAETPVVVMVSGVSTPEAATPCAEVTVTSYEKLIVRNTVPPSTRGGQVLDGPSVFTIPTIIPGEFKGPRKWQPFSCCPGATSDVTLSFVVHGQIPTNGKILIELPADGWDMDDTPQLLLRTAEYHNVQLRASWQRAKHTLEVDLGGCAIKQGTSIILTVCGVKNPDKETINASSSASSVVTSAQITSLVSSGRVIDGPTKIDVACISELRESDFNVAKQAFDQARVDGHEFLSVEKLPEVLLRTGVALSQPLYEALVVGLIPVRITPEPVLETDAATPLAPQPQANQLTREEFLNMFAQVYAPAYKYGQELRLACGRGEVDRIEEFIRRGCDPNAKDGSGWTALHYGADYGHVSSVNCVVDTVSAVKSLSTNPETAAFSLDINIRDLHGWTPLMCAAANGHTEVVARLLALGADLSIATSQGRTALHWAATRGMDGCVATLLAAGADKDRVDRSGWTPLHCATLHGSDTCCKILVDHGAKTNVKDKLHYLPSTYDAPSSSPPAAAVTV